MKYSYVFKSGLKVEGTVAEIALIAKSLNETLDLSKLPRPQNYYWSESKSTYIAIKDMASTHIRNALCKLAVSYYEELGADRKALDSAFCKKFVGVADSPVVQELYQELYTRH